MEDASRSAGLSPLDQALRGQLVPSGADDRDRAATAADEDADLRDGAAARRDRRAENVDGEARARERQVARQAIRIARRLAEQGGRDALRWAEAIAAVDEALTRVETTDTQHTQAALQHAETALDAQTAALFQAGLDRDELSRELREVADLLFISSQERRAAAADRRASQSDRHAAQTDRDVARSARQQAAIDRAKG